MGSINSECRVGFQWLPPLSQSIGCAFGYQAIAPTDIDASLHAQLCSSPPYKESHAQHRKGLWNHSPTSPIRQGVTHYDGLFKFFPCRIASRTPERLDSDPVLTLCLACCSSPDSCGCGRQSLEARLQQELVSLGFSDKFMFTPRPNRRGHPAKLFPTHSVSSSYVPPVAPPAPIPFLAPVVPADPRGSADDPGAISPESIFKKGVRDAPAPPDDASVKAWVE